MRLPMRRDGSSKRLRQPIVGEPNFAAVAITSHDFPFLSTCAIVSLLFSELGCIYHYLCFFSGAGAYTHAILPP